MSQTWTEEKAARMQKLALRTRGEKSPKDPGEVKGTERTKGEELSPPLKIAGLLGHF